jgi:hypothetical protein
MTRNKETMVKGYSSVKNGHCNVAKKGDFHEKSGGFTEEKRCYFFVWRIMGEYGVRDGILWIN